ncbi:conserved exported hypothetical protein [Candidatus Sulfopaludibacter sp. SbA3]|nr:conserved exported hypothetical protein [Candidatus Sulfopaludibacter sp. SbA3]
MLGRFSPGCSGFFLPLVLFGIAPLCSAQQLSDAQTARERTLQTQSFAAEKLWLWQKRLSLQDWNISVEMTRSSDLKPKTLGNIHWDLDKKSAVIHVLDPADYHMPFRDMLKDMEFTVVHELIHLELSPVLSPLPRSDANRVDEEHAVNQMADALLKLDRGQ